MYVNHDLECFLQEMMLFATVPVFEVKTVPQCNMKLFQQSVDDYSLTKWRFCKKRHQHAMETIRDKSIALVKTLWNFNIGEIKNVQTENITVAMYQANLEATGLLISVEKLLSEAKKM